MKKLVLSMLAIASLVFTSCSDSDDGPGSGSQLENQLPGNIVADLTLDASIKYNLTGATIVNPGVTLTIPAGTKIEALAGGTSVYLAVLKGADIVIEGTNTNPVVMSSANGEQGDWGGLVICGDATTTEGVDATAEIAGFSYGGTNDEDSSGSIEFLVMRGTGAAINSDSEYNGISFYAVGSETKVENIAVINGADDGVEFFGGTVNATNLYLENNDDDSVDWTEGWNGTVTNTYISHTVAGFSTAFEADGINGNPKFDNVTAISTQSGTALQFKKTSGATITNLFLEGYGVDIDLRENGTLADVQIDAADANGTIIDAAALTYTLSADQKDGTKVDISAWTFRNANL
ncbi:hypothetical protein ACXGQW_06125 [Wenyingzhuangia sp. IMCC45533]